MSPFQASFIPGQAIQDNIIITSEIIHSIRNKKGKTGYMIIKINLEKAYDRLKWEFMEDVLKEIDIPPFIRKVIMNCITTPLTNVLWHGLKMEGFKTSRGIRQDDPISPYLFVLCMEKLTHIIMEE